MRSRKRRSKIKLTPGVALGILIGASPLILAILVYLLFCGLLGNVLR